MAHELEALLDNVAGPNPRPIKRVKYLDYGLMRAFGQYGKFRIKSKTTGEDVTTAVRASFPHGPAAFHGFLSRAERKLNRMILDGPTKPQEVSLRGIGWDPYAADRVARQRAEQEREQVEVFNSDPKWRKGRIRDVVAARELVIELNRPLFRGLYDRKAPLQSVFRNREESRRAVDSMPSVDVSITLKASYHQDPRHVWTQNDVFDIDAMASTLPYCDIVATDKEVASHIRRSGLASRFDTMVISKLDELRDHL
jgi:hypothetical protein